MPEIKNEAYKKFHIDKVIDLVDTNQLELWLEDLHNKKMPRGVTSIDRAKALLILIYYSGARPAEIMDLQPINFTEKKLDTRKTIYEITITTVKKGVRKRTLPIPKTKHTELMFQTIKKLPPNYIIFKDFKSDNTNTVSWDKKKDYYIKENGETKHEVYTETKTEHYPRPAKKLSFYITNWTGLPPYFFRHNRFSWMADKGATDQQIQFFKGAKSPASVQPYKNLSTRQHKELIKYF